MRAELRRDVLMSPEPGDSDDEVRSAAIFGLVTGPPLLAAGVAMFLALPRIYHVLPRSRALGLRASGLCVLPLMIGALHLSFGIFRLLHGSPHRRSEGLLAAFARGLTVMVMVVAAGVGAIAMVMLLSFLNDLS